MMFGFSHEIVLAYLIFVTLHATWTHCNFGPSVKWLEPFLVMPRYHHWHHSSQTEAIDKNFAVLLSCVDQMFGTAYRPDRWPSRYGVLDGKPPDEYLGQLTYPFRAS